MHPRFPAQRNVSATTGGGAAQGAGDPSQRAPGNVDGVSTPVSRELADLAGGAPTRSQAGERPGLEQIPGEIARRIAMLLPPADRLALAAAVEPAASGASEPASTASTAWTEAPRATLEAWVADAPADEERARVSAHILDPPTRQQLLLMNYGLRTLPRRLDELCPSITSLTACGNRLHGPLDLIELPHQLSDINLSNNGFTALRGLERYVQLRIVCLGFNQLEELSVLGSLPLLQQLYLHTNNFRIAPVVTQNPQLLMLHLARNPLVEFPDVQGLVNLRVLYLNDTLLTSLPRWIEALPRMLRINLNGCPLDAESRALIETLQREERGPEISYSPPPLPPRPRRVDEGTRPRAALSTPLQAQVSIWLATRPEMPDDQRQALLKRWESFAREPDAEHFSDLLSRLRETKDFQSGKIAREVFGQRVADVLDVLARHADLRSRCFAIALEGVSTCGDRIAIAFGNIQIVIGQLAPLALGVTF